MVQWGGQLAAAGLTDKQLRVGLAWKSTGGAGEALIYQRMRHAARASRRRRWPALNAAERHEGRFGWQFVSLQMGADVHECAATEARAYRLRGRHP